jgi:hypothetical protein
MTTFAKGLVKKAMNRLPAERVHNLIVKETAVSGAQVKVTFEVVDGDDARKRVNVFFYVPHAGQTETSQLFGLEMLVRLGLLTEDDTEFDPATLDSLKGRQFAADIKHVRGDYGSLYARILTDTVVAL